MSASGGGSSTAETTLSALLAPHLPYLRRYARALCGDQRSGDAYVASVLEALIADRGAIDLSRSPKTGLYKLFHAIWSSSGARMEDPADETMRRLTTRSRQALLLRVVEEFSIEDVAAIMAVSVEESEALLNEARAELGRQSRARVLIIEDEPIIAMDLESIVAETGHEVIGVADTHRRAVAVAGEQSPDLILADIQLADGSSGIDAVEDILRHAEMPVIFITAYPERLLTGERPEPTYLITKPFRPEMVAAAISQALFHNG